MIIRKMFEGDDVGNIDKPYTDVMCIQKEMYGDTWVFIYKIVTLHYFQNPMLQNYFDDDEIRNMDETLDELEDDVIEPFHDQMAAAFRWDYNKYGLPVNDRLTNDAIAAELKKKMWSADFLKEVNPDCYIVCRSWLHFLKRNIIWNVDILRTLGRLLYSRDEVEYDKRYDNAELAAELVKKKYPDIPWNHYARTCRSLYDKEYED